MLGRCVARRLDTLGHAWIGTDLELDIADQRAVDEFLGEHAVAAIINCAAYTAVDAAETDKDSALRVNAQGPQRLALACHSRGYPLVHFSTDYVFDGERPGEHTEDSPVGPCNVYGRTKLEGERLVTDAFASSHLEGTRPWHILRTSWLFGAGRSSFVDTMWKLMLEKTELRIVNDQYGRPTYAQDLADAAIRAAGLDASAAIPSGIWHFANAGPVSWYEFAAEIRVCLTKAQQSLAIRDLVPVSSDEFPRPAKRPKNSVLSTKRLETDANIVPRHWRDALREYISWQTEQRGIR